MKNDAYITKKCPVQFWDFVMIEDDLWYAASGFNGLFRADLKSKISKFVGYFPVSPIMQRICMAVFVDGGIN